jgi:hypothetical protein
MKFLAQIMAEITRHPRYKVVAGKNFEWSSKLWTHNLFRVYELIFWRRYGARAESSVFRKNGKVVTVCHTWEATIVHFEVYLRNFSKWRFPYRVHVNAPILQTPQGIPVFVPQYLFAVAYESANTGVYSGSSTDENYNHTTSGSDQFLTVAMMGRTSIGTNLTATAAGNTMTVIDRITQVIWAAVDETLAFFSYAGLGAGTHSIHILNSGSATQISGCSVNYSGVGGAGATNKSSQASPATDPYVLGLTTTVDNSLVVGAFNSGGGVDLTAGTATTERVANAVHVSIFEADSLTSPTGARNLTVYQSSGPYDMRGIVIELTPPVAGGGTALVSPNLLTLSLDRRKITR